MPIHRGPGDVAGMDQIDLAAERRGPGSPGSRRDRLAVLLALVTVVCLGAAFYFSPRARSS